MKTQHHHKNKPSNRGFALIVALSLLVLLMILMLAMVNLSSSTQRSLTHERLLIEAQANARMALQLAIGELQSQLGPDQRISAPSAIMSTEEDSTLIPNGRLTGVWESRQDSLEAANTSATNYAKDHLFRRWLVSCLDEEAVKRADFVTSNDAFSNPVPLLKGDPGNEVFADLLPVKNGNSKITGHYAWWVGDENCKGYVNPTSLTKPQDTLTPSDAIASAATPGSYGTEAIIPLFPSNSAESSKVITHKELALALGGVDESAKYFHDLSPFPRSVLANVVNGGLRHDLSLFLEKTTMQNLPAWPQGGPTTPLGPNNKIALSNVDDFDVLAWKQLAAWTQQRKKITLTAARPTLLAVNSSKANNDVTNPRWNTGTLRPTPIPLRYLLFSSFGTIPDPVDPNKLRVRLYIYPVIVLWNPYNIDLRAERFQTYVTNLPIQFQIYKNNVIAQTYTWANGTANQPYTNQPTTIKAGQSIILTPTSWRPIGNQNMMYVLEPKPIAFTKTRGSVNGPVGAGGEWGGSIVGGDTDIIVEGIATDKIKVKTIVKAFNGGAGRGFTNDQGTFDIRSDTSVPGTGAWSTFLWPSKLCWRYESNSPWSPDKTAQSPIIEDTFLGVKEAPRPFMVMDIKLKTLDESEIPNKTWSHCIPAHPFQGVTNTSVSAPNITPDFLNAYRLTFNSVSSVEEVMSYLQLNPSDTTQTYFGTSNFPGDGQSLITDVEIPLAPLTSLAQLQNLPQGSIDNLYSSGFYFQNHAIGNSFASPGVPSDKVKNTYGNLPFWVDQYYNTIGRSIGGTQYPATHFHNRPNIDRSYAANHLLWDHYFFSSLSPQDSIINANKKTLSQVVNDFYNEVKPLPNERYKPYLSKPIQDVIDQLILSNNPTNDAHLKAAASLIVDGGFNVNSVSVDAWKTLLATLHKRHRANMPENAAPTTQPTNDTFSTNRFSLTNGQASAQNWNGNKELTEEQIDALARAIVKQVKARGPFRSLAEFVNRRLGEESDPLTRYGALQAALEDPDVDINKDYKENSADLIEKAFLTSKNVTYPNLTAATGSRYEGASCYVTQADLLGPIAPVLNARSDTFTIRALGQATAPNGKTVSVRCEAVVQRIPDYLDPSDAPEIPTASLSSPSNKSFGRRFVIVHFRWLSSEEL